MGLLEVSVPLASSDGLYHGRYPQGNALGAQLTGGASSVAAAVAALTTGIRLNGGPVSLSAASATLGSAGAGFIAANNQGYDGLVTVSPAGVLVNGHGNPFQIRGVNEGAFASAIYSNQPITGQRFGNTGPGGIPFPTLAAWGANGVRISMNASAFLNVIIGALTGSPTSPSWGTTMQADPNGIYKNAVILIERWARKYNMHTLWDCHFSAPKFTFGGVTHYLGAYGQPLFMDYDCTLPYWTAAYGAGPGVTDAAGYPSSGLPAFMARWFGSAALNTMNSAPGAGGVIGAAGDYWDPNIGGWSGVGNQIYELFNEPQVEQQTLNMNSAANFSGTVLTSTQLMGQGGYISGFSNSYVGTGSINGVQVGLPQGMCGNSGQPNTNGNAYCFNYPVRMVGYGTVVSGIRGLNFPNVISLSGPSYAAGFSDMTTYWPVGDRQLTATWHPYGNGSFPSSSDPHGGYAFNGTKYGLQVVAAVIAGSASYTVNGTTMTGLGYPVPVLATEYGTSQSSSTPDQYCQSIHQWQDNQTDTHTGTASPGLFHSFIWAWPDPGGVTGYGGNPASSSWQSCILAAPQNIVGSVSNVVQTGYDQYSGLLTVSNAVRLVTTLYWLLTTSV